MSTIKTYEYPNCPKKCRKTEHGLQITEVLFRLGIANVPDDKLAAFIAKTCRNFPHVVDSLGRSGLHVAAKVGRYAIAEWLLNHGADVNAKDLENGQFPIHEAIDTGCLDIAVLLMRYGADWNVSDYNWCSPAQMIRAYEEFRIARQLSNNDLLVWGLNKNYNIGIGDEQDRQTPQFIDYFRKNQISIAKVAISSFHSLFLDDRHQLYVVGHGQGGRLGIDTEVSLASPSWIRLKLKTPNDRITDISCSKNHSMILTSSCAVFVCGSNDHLQLGLRPAPKMTTSFKEVVTIRDFRETSLHTVVAQDAFSLVYSQNIIYGWGANYGQFGGANSDPHLSLPRTIFVPERGQVRLVATSACAIAVYTTVVLLFYNFKTRTIKPPYSSEIKAMSMHGGDSVNSPKGSIAELRLFVLTDSNEAYIWYENSQSFLKCTITQKCFYNIEKILFKANRVLLLSQGYVYEGKVSQLLCQPSKQDMEEWIHTNRNDISSSSKVNIKLSRVTGMDRVVDIFADEDLTSFAAVQEGSKKYLNMPKLPTEEPNFAQLLSEASEYDAIHDIVFHVQYQTFPAHKFIVFYRAPGMRAVAERGGEGNGKDVHLDMPELTATIFEWILKYIYCDYIPTSEDVERLLGTSGYATAQDFANSFIAVAKEFDLLELANIIESNFIQPSPLGWMKQAFSKLKRTILPDLYDVTIKCAEDKEIQAHKCVLISLEYFNSMFSNSWCEQSSVNLSSVPHESMLLIVDFLYRQDVEYFRRQMYHETFIYNMIVVCDQFLATRMRQAFEVLLLEKISIRRCGEMLEFATMYNCEVLRSGALEFICQNAERVLAARALESCEPEILRACADAYRALFNLEVHSGESTRYDLVDSFVGDFKVDLYYVKDEAGDKDEKAKQKTKGVEGLRSVRQYEQEAISKDQAAEEGANIPQKKQEALQVETASWMKVVEKKKNAAAAAAATSAPVEEQPKAELAAITPTKPELVRQDSDETSPMKRLNLSLGDFSLQKSEKISQKQKKRLSSDSHTVAIPVSTPNKSSTPSPSVWGVCATPEADPVDFDLAKSPPRRSSGSMSSPAASSSSASFAQIQAEAKQQKSYYERMRTKSLALTQIEETAIRELRDFYNVDNAADEVITIERKANQTRVDPMQRPLWERN